MPSDPTPGYVMANCPFCGKRPWGIFGPSDLGSWWVECHGPDENGCCGNWHFSPDAEDRAQAREEVRAAWNRRAAASPTVALPQSLPVLPAEEAKPGAGFDLTRAMSSLDALNLLCRLLPPGYAPEVMQNVNALCADLSAAEEEIRQLVRALHVEVDPPIFMGEPAGAALPVAPTKENQA
jgi:hypothetical protein